MTNDPVTRTAADLFDEHMRAELKGDLDRTMATMSDEPHLNHVPVRAGAFGRPSVRHFYDQHLVGKFFPPDMEMTRLSRTVGETQVVDELIFSFTHTHPIDWMLPGVPPTGHRVQLPLVVIVRVHDGKVAHEHIYWDQASVLVQVGLLDPTGLPVTGADQAEQLLDPSRPYRDHYEQT